MATGRMLHATFQDAMEWINTAWILATTDTSLTGFGKSGLIENDANCESNNNLTDKG